MSMMMNKIPARQVSAGRNAAASSAGVVAKAVLPVPASVGRCSCGKLMCNGRHSVAANAATVEAPAAPAPAAPAPAPAAPAAAQSSCPSSTLAERHDTILKHFPKALSADDYMARVEIALAGYGFTGDNTIAMSNLCRDESCMVLEDKIESVFGSCFSTHGLGGVLTCGVIGIKAGLSHSPVVQGKDRYVFFSMPHIAIDSDGNVGKIARPNRPGMSSACGALIAVTGELQSKGLDANCSEPGNHDPLEPEYSILKQRLARRLKHEGADHSKLDLVSVTHAAERTITSDLEYLIEKAVDPSKADYAVFTGVQIHNWAADLNNGNTPSLEFVSVGRSYVVVNGQKTFLDLHQVPALSPRQLKIMAALSAGMTEAEALATAGTATGMIQEIPREYLLKRLGGAAGQTTMSASGSPNWKEYVTTTYAESHPNAPKMDDKAFVETAPPKKESFFSSFFGIN